MDQNGCIGNGDQMPWPRLKKDMKFFRKTTKNHAVIMGSKTYRSIGSPLKKRTNIVLSRRPELLKVPPQVHVFDNPEKALTKAYEFDKNPFIIGGAEIYGLFLPQTTRMYITEIASVFEGNVFFPNFEEDEWNEISSVEDVEEAGGLSYRLTFRQLERLDGKITVEANER